MNSEQIDSINENEKNKNYDGNIVDVEKHFTYNVESNSVEVFRRNNKHKCSVNPLESKEDFDVQFNTFEADDTSVIQFSDKQMTIITPDRTIETKNYTKDSEKNIAVDGNIIEIDFINNSIIFDHKKYYLSKNKLVVNGNVYTVTQEDRNKCFIEDTDHSLIIFIFDHENWDVEDEIKTAFVRGSFTSWKDDNNYFMTYSKNLKLHYVGVNSENIKNCIGNSGHPEYKFYINDEYIGTDDASFVPEGYIFHTCDANLIVIFSNEDINEIIKESDIAGTIKHLSDFDLTTREGKEEISNFRLVPGTKKLFRSFHPYYSTGKRNISYDTEKTRIALVQELAKVEGIKSDINLTEDCSKYEGVEMKWYDGTTDKVTIPKYYQEIIDTHSVCHVQSASGIAPSYNYVYNQPRDPLFYEWVQMIVDFIINDVHKAPFEIHCAIGTDRTGVFSALLGALCGATWKKVSDDYQKTNRMCIKEYRSKALLAQSFQRLLGVKDITEVDNLQESLWNHFTTSTLNGKPVLTREKLEALKNKLN